jgi:hypothetical protein
MNLIQRPYTQGMDVDVMEEIRLILDHITNYKTRVGIANTYT